MKTINIRVVPDDLHREAKAAAAKEGKTFQNWILETIKKRLEELKQEK